GQLRAALDDELPAITRDGGFIRPGFSADLDENRKLRDESKQVIAGLQKQYADLTGIKALKIKHNNVLGYFVDVSAQYGKALMEEPLNATFIHRQTLANAMRFTTTELGQLEQKIQAAAGRAIAIELEIFSTLVARVCAKADEISLRAAAIAGLDVFAALAELAVVRRYNRPVVDNSLSFEINAGRHPVVEAALKKTGESDFIANDCNLSGNAHDGEKSIWLLTGPNMAGKSTFLRQNALIALMAQTGSFVPAEHAHIGIVDRLFSRVGAADDLARGRSTFMVEMVETATILNQASSRSLVILDEIGRGTATFDGLSIAWGCVEYLHEVNKCRALFATHFHELTSLSSKLDNIGNATMKVREWKGDVVFLHEVGPGAADRSYGIQVAKLAGLPEAVIERASDVLKTLEEKRSRSDKSEAIDDLPLFNAPRPVSITSQPAKPSAAMEKLAEIFPDEMTPRQALDALYQLKALSDK
ncbi:MAG TPA: DNA mismatch repair protein MutS, partial [Rhizobiales bacterium]|nr:DNA mismatch repair protein MutS [Hyphomicrobiales bacterium]